MLSAAFHRLIFVAILAGPDAPAGARPEAGRDSLEYRLDIGKDELLGPAPARTPARVKAEIRPLLRGLRSDGKGLKAVTEANIESFFTVADTFEAKSGGKVFQHCLRGIGRDGTMVCCVRVAGGMDAEEAIKEWLKVSPTWIDDQSRDGNGVPEQLKAVRQFQRELRRRASPGKP
jgi:hypothetical protein